jgi:hypothetical protein
MQVKRPSNGPPGWLYTGIVVVLGLYFVIGGITWSVLIYNGIQAPEAFATILATIAGGLVGVLSPVSVAARPPRSREAEPTGE